MILIDFFETLAFAGVCALVAFVYRFILLAEPVLHWWLKFGEKFADKWWHAPVWGCHKCIAGQLALWGYLYWKLIYISGKLPAQNSYSLVGHIFAICGAILFVILLRKIIKEEWI